MGPDVHAVAAAGYGAAAGTYARARPGYPPELAPWLLAALDAEEVLELGAGTGKLTRLLTDAGATVTAVEPVRAMREHLAGLERVHVLDARAEQLPLADGSVAAAVFSQSLHWCDVPAALAELDRVLVPGGRLALVWNFRDTAVAWQAELDELFARLRGDAPHSRDGRWQSAAAASAFRIVERRDWRWQHGVDVRGVLDRVLSVSYVAALDPAARDAVCADVRGILARRLGASGDADPVAFPYVTEAYVLARAQPA